MSDKVTGEDLIYMDKTELRNLGISVMKDRRALLKAISQLSKSENLAKKSDEDEEGEVEGATKDGDEVTK